MIEIRRWMAAALVLVVVGCGGSSNKLGRLPISGAITLDGAPLKRGHIVFEPTSGQPTQSGGMIHDGKFDVPEAKGAAPGTYLVAIFSGDEAPPSKFEAGTPEAEAEAMRTKTRGEQVPRRYNVDTELTAEVKRDAENVFNFDLKRSAK